MDPGADSPVLRRVCVHEYAHLAVARHFGATGFVRVLRTGGAASAPRYAGRFQMFGNLDDDAWRIVALAGVIAEWLDDGGAPDVVAVAARLRDDLRGVDAELARGYTDDDVQRCMAIVCSAWRGVVDDAEGHAGR